MPFPFLDKLKSKIQNTVPSFVIDINNESLNSKYWQNSCIKSIIQKIIFLKIGNWIFFRIFKIFCKVIIQKFNFRKTGTKTLHILF